MSHKPYLESVFQWVSAEFYFKLLWNMEILVENDFIFVFIDRVVKIVSFDLNQATCGVRTNAAPLGSRSIVEYLKKCLLTP